MKRSEINAAEREFEEMCREQCCFLPPFCRFTPEEWLTKGHDYDEVRECMLGWEVSDYGFGDFDSIGCTMVTIRNGSRQLASRYPKIYVEKLLYIREGQHTPNHYHWSVTEDVINRGGGNVRVTVYNSHMDDTIDYITQVTVHKDGKAFDVPAGYQIRLLPGESVQIPQFVYHSFDAEPGTGPVLLGVISQSHDEKTDNKFNPPAERVCEIEEDEPPYRLLCHEYPEAE